MEEYRDLTNEFGKRYKVSNLGNVKSENFTDSLGRTRFGKILKPIKDKCGYVRVRISIGILRGSFLIHRLVALAFIPNPLNLPQVNHKDGNKLNNHVENLEWCTAKENINHSWNKKLTSAKYGIDANSVKTKLQVLKDGELITELYGEKEINDFGLTSCGVWSTLNKRQDSHRGYTFNRIKIKAIT